MKMLIKINELIIQIYYILFLTEKSENLDIIYKLMQAQKNTKLVLLFGATGKTGFHIAHALIDSGFAVRIMVRSKAKVTQLFRQKQIAFEKIVEGKLKDEETLSVAFQSSSRYGSITYVISALGAGANNEESIQQVQYLSQVRIIEQCKEHKIEKYVFVTAAYMERPYSPITVILNTIVPNVYASKAKAQNYLRKSGLNYAIVRPTGLVGDEKLCKITPYKLGQGDKLGGRITRCTVGKIILQVIQSKQITPKLTFQCTGCSQLDKSQSLSVLKADNESNIVKANYRAAKYTYGIVLLSLIGLTVAYFLNRGK